LDTAEHAKTGEAPKSVQCTDILKKRSLSNDHRWSVERRN